MQSSGMWRCVVLIRTAVSEKPVFLDTVERIRELGETSANC
jgi:hypothetical protein